MAWMPGEDLLKRLWETIEKTGAGLASPWQIRREGKARADVRRHELLVEAQTKAAIDAWRSGDVALKTGEDGLLQVAHASPRLLSAPATDTVTSDDGTLAIAASREVPHFVEHSLTRAAVTEAEQTINLRAAIREAEEIVAAAAQQPQPDLPPPADDWVNAWREGAERVSDEELRKVWARLLVNEVIAPGAYSLRTLAFVRTLDHADARLIRTLSSLVADGARVFKTPEYLRAAGLDFSELIHLEEIGLLSGVSGLGLQVQYEVPGNSRIAVVFRSGAVFFYPDQPKNFSLPCYKLTSIGAEIVKLEPPSPVPQQYLTEVSKQFEEQGLKRTPIRTA